MLALSAEHQLATMDAAAIQAAVAVLTSGSSRAERKTFVISDGYGEQTTAPMNGRGLKAASDAAMLSCKIEPTQF